jgi:hypothetical protein
MEVASTRLSCLVDPDELWDHLSQLGSKSGLLRSEGSPCADGSDPMSVLAKGEDGLWVTFLTTADCNWILSDDPNAVRTGVNALILAGLRGEINAVVTGNELEARNLAKGQ